MLASVLRDFKTHLYMTLCAEMIYLIGIQVIDNIRYLFPIGQVTIVKMQPRILDMRIDIDVVNSHSVERARTSYDSVNLITLRKEKFSKIRTILSGDSGDESLSSLAYISRKRLTC